MDRKGHEMLRLDSGDDGSVNGVTFCQQRAGPMQSTYRKDLHEQGRTKDVADLREGGFSFHRHNHGAGKKMGDTGHLGMERRGVRQ